MHGPGASRMSPSTRVVAATTCGTRRYKRNLVLLCRTSGDAQYVQLLYCARLQRPYLLSQRAGNDEPDTDDPEHRNSDEHEDERVCHRLPPTCTRHHVRPAATVSPWGREQTSIRCFQCPPEM